MKSGNILLSIVILLTWVITASCNKKEDNNPEPSIACNYDDSDMGEVIDYYGFGLMRIDNEYGTWVGHMGNHIGSAAYVFYSVEKDITLVVATNMGTFFSFKYKKLIFFDLLNDLMEVMFGGNFFQ